MSIPLLVLLPALLCGTVYAGFRYGDPVLGGGIGLVLLLLIVLMLFNWWF